MRQILQNLKTGVTKISYVPTPLNRPGIVLIQTRNSLISSGTEKSLIEFSQSSLIGKAKAQPERVLQVLSKIKTDGLLPTLDAVFKRLDEPLPLGYCNAGIVIGAKKLSHGKILKDGDRVVSNGPHAEIVAVPYNLCAKIPDNVTDEQAAFTVLASIGLQGIRLATPALGEKFVVYGLGLIGLIVVQLLRINGCEVLGIDINPYRLALAKKYGAKIVDAKKIDPVTAAMSWSKEQGVDGVLITASASTDEIIHKSAEMSRKRGRIILVGVVGLNLRRGDFYEKELTFQVSCSYGPGRYDENYEKAGHDYPFGFVRWTEQRNFEAILQLMSSGKLLVGDLITHRIPFTDAPRAYELMKKDSNALGIILQYPEKVEGTSTVYLKSGCINHKGDKAVVGVIGSGNFAKMTLLPALERSEASLAYISDLKGEAALHLADKFSFSRATTDYKQILEDVNVNAVIIATGHNSHAKLICESLKAGKHVFVEKPLAMNIDEVKQIIKSLNELPNQSENMPSLMVGFNRRFSAHAQKIKSLLDGHSEPLAINITVNAGIIPSSHWVHNPVLGGGRIIGEACHFIDLMVYLTDSPVLNVAAMKMGAGTTIREDKMSISLEMADGSIGTVSYFANGNKAYPKEMLEVFSEGRIVRIDNFRRTTGYGFNGFRKLITRRQDKGHTAEFVHWVNFVSKGGEPLIPLNQMINVTLASFAAMNSAEEKRMIILDNEYRIKTS